MSISKLLKTIKQLKVDEPMVKLLDPSISESDTGEEIADLHHVDRF